MEPVKSIINSFGYLHQEAVIHIDLYTEQHRRYKKDQFQKFLIENRIDDTCIFMSFSHDGRITPLYKYSLFTSDGKSKLKAHTRTRSELIDLCYQICITIRKNSERGSFALDEILVTG